MHLARAGADVSMVARGAHLAAMQAHGLRLLIEGSERIEWLPCSDDPAEFGPQDYLIIALKSHDIPPAIETMQPLLAPGTSVVTASNGLPYWYFCGDVPLAGTVVETIDPGGKQWKILEPARAIGCVVYPACEIIAPGVIRHEHGRKFPIGEPDGKSTSRIQQLHELFVAGGLEAPIRPDIRNEIWLKLIGNVCFNPISALTLATIDLVTTDPGTRAVCEAMMLETKAVGERLGLHMRVEIKRRLDGATALGPHKMSMLQDLEHGRSMEVEPLVGVVQELGRLTGVATPIVDTVLALIRQRATVAAQSLR